LSRSFLTRFDDAEGLGAAAAKRFLSLGLAAIQERGVFTVALSGGRGPLALFQALHAASKTLPWSKVRLYWADERWVPNSHPDSNFGTARRLFLEPLDAVGSARPVNTGLASPEAGAQDYATRLQADFSSILPQFDLCLLGMGPDGHTASLFPGSPALAVQDKLCVNALQPQSGQDRITLTFPVLNASHNVLFLVTGADKEALLLQALKGPDPAIPASHVLGQGDCHWFYSPKNLA
jgi:6-phosphogluconolactonase